MIAEAAEVTGGLLCIGRVPALVTVYTEVQPAPSRAHRAYGRRLADAPVGGRRCY